MATKTQPAARPAKRRSKIEEFLNGLKSNGKKYWESADCWADDDVIVKNFSKVK